MLFLSMAILSVCLPMSAFARSHSPPKKRETQITYQSFTAQCPPQTLQRWNTLSYDITTPKSSQVEFSAFTSDIVKPDAPNFQSVATAKNGLPLWKQGKADIFGPMVNAGANARGKYLILRIEQRPAREDGSMPTIRSLKPTFVCSSAK